jgi:hypothetical protein
VPSVRGQVFNVGSDEQNYTLAQVGDVIHRLVPEARMMRQRECKDRRNYRVSFAKIRNELGFLPKHTLEDGVRDIQAALRSGLVADYRDKRYSNYQSLCNGSRCQRIRSRHITALYAPPPVDELVRVAEVATAVGSHSRGGG